MNLNELFYHAALRQLKIGTTADEFANAYANASKENPTNSIWQNLFNEGKEIFRHNLDVISANDKIDENEFNLFSYFINFLKNLPSRKNEQHCTPYYQGETNDIGVLGRDSRTYSIEGEPECTDKEIYHLKPLKTMSREECIAELKLYYPNQDFDNMEDDDIKGKLAVSRSYLINHDKGSDEIDYHIGTFAQGGQGTCGVLSETAQLSDDEVRRLVTEGEDENGKYYMVVFPMDINNPNGAVKIYESEVMSGRLNVKITDENGERTETVSSFATGDADVRLFEMAYVRKFGTKLLETGEEMGRVQNIFTYQGTPMVESIDSEVTEEKLLAANSGKAILCLTYMDLENESMSYLDTYTDPSGLTASYAPRQDFKALKFEFKLKFPQVNEDLYKDLSENEFLEFSLPFIYPATEIDKAELEKLPIKERIIQLQRQMGFNPTCKVVMSNGDSFIDEHAYIFRSYNPDTKEVTISEPNSPTEDHIIPLEVAKKFFRISF